MTLPLETSEEQNEILIPTPLRKRIALLLIKLCIVSGIFWFVFNTIDIDDLKQRLTSLPLEYVIIAMIFLNLSQVSSAMRMRHYFGYFHRYFDHYFCVALYLVGSLYGIILPGGISGDAYRAYLLRKLYTIPVRSSLRLVLCERANGMFILCLLACIYGFFGQTKTLLPMANVTLILGLIILIPIYFMAAKVILRDPPAVALGASFYSILTQIFVSAAACSIFLGMGVTWDIMWDYLLIFMLAAVASILPLSVGATGIRELVFTVMITFFNTHGYDSLDIETGVAAMLVFFAAHITTSLEGLIFAPQLKKLSQRPSKENTHGTT